MPTDTEVTETSEVPTAHRATTPVNWGHLLQTSAPQTPPQHPSSPDDDVGGAD